MTKKWALTLTITTIICSLLLGCTNFKAKEQIISEVSNVKFTVATKIVFSDGRGKNQPFILTDKKKVNEFIKLLNNYVIKTEKRHEDIKGWTHKADFYKGNKKLMSITFSNPLKIDNKYYDIVKGQLLAKDIDIFIKHVNEDWIY